MKNLFIGMLFLALHSQSWGANISPMNWAIESATDTMYATYTNKAKYIEDRRVTAWAVFDQECQNKYKSPDYKIDITDTKVDKRADGHIIKISYEALCIAY